MSWWIGLSKELDGEPIEVESFTEGGTYAVGGSTEADLNVTYNYSTFYYNNLDSKKGIKWLHNKKASECIERLKLAVHMLGTDRSNYYWAPTPGNAGYTLSILLKWAEKNPDAYFYVH